MDKDLGLTVGHVIVIILAIFIGHLIAVKLGIV